MEPIKTTIILFGLPVKIQYVYHGPNQIEWHLDKNPEAVVNIDYYSLLEQLLRYYCNNKISLLLWEEIQAIRYEEDARAAALADDIPF